MTVVVNIRSTDTYDTYIGRGENGDAHMLNTAPREEGWLGNPHPVEQPCPVCPGSPEHSRNESLDRFENDFLQKIRENPEFRQQVKTVDGDTLGCYCMPQPCHGEIIKDYVEGRLACPCEQPDCKLCMMDSLGQSQLGMW